MRVMLNVFAQMEDDHSKAISSLAVSCVMPLLGFHFEEQGFQEPFLICVDEWIFRAEACEAQRTTAG